MLSFPCMAVALAPSEGGFARLHCRARTGKHQVAACLHATADACCWAQALHGQPTRCNSPSPPLKACLHTVAMEGPLCPDMSEPSAALCADRPADGAWLPCSTFDYSVRCIASHQRASACNACHSVRQLSTMLRRRMCIYMHAPTYGSSVSVCRDGGATRPAGLVVVLVHLPTYLPGHAPHCSLHACTGHGRTPKPAPQWPVQAACATQQPANSRWWSVRPGVACKQRAASHLGGSSVDTQRALPARRGGPPAACATPHAGQRGQLCAPMLLCATSHHPPSPHRRCMPPAPMPARISSSSAW